MNIWDVEWEQQEAEPWYGGGERWKWLSDNDAGLSVCVCELDQGGFVAYHAHHHSEEFLVVLRGRLTLQTTAGERPLEEGELAYFGSGPAHAHGFRNDNPQTARYLMVGTRVTPEITEFPQLGKVTIQSRHGLHVTQDL